MANSKIFRCFLEWVRIFQNESAFGQTISMRYEDYVIIYKVDNEYVEIYRVINRYQDITRIFD